MILAPNTKSDKKFICFAKYLSTGRIILQGEEAKQVLDYLDSIAAPTGSTGSDEGVQEMTDEELQKEIKKTLPEGYIIITSGKVQEGDIIVIFNVDNIMWQEAYNFTIGDNVKNLWGVARKQY